MAQHDYVIANGTGAAVRSDLNNALAAIVSQNSGSTEPATTYAYMMWPDTTAGVMKMRNGANSAWIELFELDGEFGSKTFNGNITLNAQGDLRFADSDSSNWVAFQSPATVSSNVTWTLPSADGTNGQALTTNGSGTLSWTSPTSTTDKITEGNTEAEVVDTGSDGHFKVTTEGIERFRCDSSGRLLVGTSSARNYNGLGIARLQLEGAGYAASTLAITNNENVVDGSYFILNKSRGTSVGSYTVVQSGDKLGSIWFQGTDGTTEIRAASIEAVVDGTPGNLDMPGRIVLSTTADGASSPTERLRITSTGQVRLAGAGITFNGDTATANELDDYEEGTWTPSVGGNATYTNQDGKYTKIGNTVYIEGHLQIATLGTGSTTTMSGLPFAAGATVEGGLTVTYFSALAVNVISLVLGVNALNTNTTAYSRTTAGTGSSSVAIYGNNARIYFYGHYFV